MGMLSKVIAILLLVLGPIHAAFIHNVDAGNVSSEPLKHHIIARFKGRFVHDLQLEQFMHQLRSKGTVKTASHAIHTKAGLTTLEVTVEETQVITGIQFRHLPMWDGRIRLGLKHAVGHRLNYQWLVEDIEYMNNVLVEEGFPYASVRSIQVLDDGTLDIDIESPTLAGVSFIGLNQTKPWVVMRELSLKNAQPIDQFSLDMDLESLMAMPYFSSVSPIISRVSSDNITIVYRVKERKYNRLDIGLEELEDDQGVAIYSMFKFHHAFIYSDALALQTQLGYLNEFNIRNYQLHYQQPWLFNRYHIIADAKAFMTFRSELMQNDTQSYNTSRQGGRLFFTKPFRRFRLNLGAGVRSERVVSDISTYQLNTVSVVADHRVVNALNNPKQGHQTKLIYDRGGEFLGVAMGGVDFYRLSLEHAQFIPMFPRLTLAIRGFGGIYEKQSDERTFETEKFSLGGSNSLRGYREGAFYGNYRLSFNIEPRFHISDGVVAVAFYDVGFINDTIQAIPKDSIHSGAGVGVRFITAALPLRFDLGFSDDVMIHFNISQTF